MRVHSTLFHLAGKKFYRHLSLDDTNIPGVFFWADLDCVVTYDPDSNLAEDVDNGSHIEQEESRHTSFKRYLLAWTRLLELVPYCCEPKDPELFDQVFFLAVGHLEILCKGQYPHFRSLSCHRLSGLCPIIAACNPKTLVIRNVGPDGIFGRVEYCPTDLETATFILPNDRTWHLAKYSISTDAGDRPAPRLQDSFLFFRTRVQ